MTCCGQTMRREGSKYVCGSCHGWFEPGVLRFSWQCSNCGEWYEGGDSANRPPCPRC